MWIRFGRFSTHRRTLVWKLICCIPIVWSCNISKHEVNNVGSTLFCKRSRVWSWNAWMSMVFGEKCRRTWRFDLSRGLDRKARSGAIHSFFSFVRKNWLWQLNRRILFHSFGDILNGASILKIEGAAGSKKAHSEEESLLLAWLEFHYEQQRLEKWFKDECRLLNPLEGKDEPQQRAISNFEEDLADSLVLMAVTAAYCSFLIHEFFSNVYIRPRSPEEVKNHYSTSRNCESTNSLGNYTFQPIF